ncbi:MAG: GntR family transcriptional regulator [Edaphobacter sp.]|uniref:GntR family transcriptional regulator n=1 Tax=Edaphobacter sp. TaxID=1934404 RepID=UPI0023859249|nr:GntR family transcriptional regulator [Edaphobacter sp.]MDE1176660.1 GntR family transcriptional regulator [Edaphobacter sp.]
MIFRLNPSSGIPLYLQLMEQVKHAVETGALGEGDQLPTIRSMAEELVMNPNTVVRAYRELEREGVIELRHGSGAFLKASSESRARVIRKAQMAMESMIERLLHQGLTEDELRRVFANELAKAEEKRVVAAGTERTR